MFARRNLRRNLVIITSLPFFIVVLFIIQKNRDIILPTHPSYQHDEHIIHSSQDIDEPYNVRTRRSMSYNQPSIINVDDRVQIANQIPIDSQTLPLLNVLSNNRERQEFKPIQQLSYPVINTQNLTRFVHLDLKGAAPKVDYYEKLFPFLKQLGATGLLIEYEDMFPFTNNLAVVRHGLAYTKSDIEKILKLAKNNNLQVMPLLQVYGHLEYVLKLKEFMHLREDKRYPQVITPCLEESYKVIFGMLIRIDFQINH